MCPDTMDIRGTCSNDVFDVSGKNLNRKQRVSFSRPFTTGKKIKHFFSFMCGEK